MSELTGGKFANGAVTGAIQGAMSGTDESDGRVETGSRKLRGVTTRGEIARPLFYDEDGNPINSFNSLEEALTAGKAAATLARTSSGDNYEFGVATILGPMTPEGNQPYYNSMVVTSRNRNGITWDMAGVKNLVAVNHSHPDVLGFSELDKSAYGSWRKAYPSTFRGVYMFDSRGNYLYGPKAPGLFGTRTHSCNASWSCAVPTDSTP